MSVPGRYLLRTSIQPVIRKRAPKQTMKAADTRGAPGSGTGSMERTHRRIITRARLQSRSSRRASAIPSPTTTKLEELTRHAHAVAKRPHGAFALLALDRDRKL